MTSLSCHGLLVDLRHRRSAVRIAPLLYNVGILSFAISWRVLYFSSLLRTLVLFNLRFPVVIFVHTFVLTILASLSLACGFRVFA